MRQVPPFLVFAALLGCGPTETGEVHLIPQPVSVAIDPGFTKPGEPTLVLDPALPLPDEGYSLVVDRRGATIEATTEAGLFYGQQTLAQLPDPWPRVRIEDAPRYAWRGTMLDVARHFFGPDEIKRSIDLAAAHKLNRFHLHLTDDQGWRIEIESWPDLALIGGATEVGGGEGGYLSQAEYLDLLAYAAERHVVLVPEIDMPGHINAALGAYPELNPDGVAADPYTGTNVGFSSLWLDGPSTFGFVTDVLTEVAAMTDGPYLHIGGDEAAATTEEDYAAFLVDLHGLVDGLGKTLVGWEEVGTVDLGGDFIAQTWIDEEGAEGAWAQGAETIASPADRAYLDMMYDLETPIGTFWAGLVDTRTAYEWDPGEGALGLEAPLWTESVQTRADIDLLTWPRLAGHAEIAWSPAGRHWDEYRQRLAVWAPPGGRRRRAVPLPADRLVASAAMANQNGQHFVVTGAGTGIGRAIALRLAEDGAALTLVGRRFERPEDVAGVVAWLVSSDSRGVTGQGIDVNGGAWMS
ncbi:MAG: SDR family NAD(P)-dependent oxidoreductase [Proteobacteria bacterium]|nr:SDR family NAD(P)-dependent oxidoreductase [Pseudomonadota bacterium]